MEEKRYDGFLKLVGANVRRYRAKKGLTMDQLANDADMEKRQLGRIERGEINTTVTSLKRLAEVLEIDVYLFLKIN